MSKFKTAVDVIAYPAVAFHPPNYHVTFGLGYITTPLIPHIDLRIEPRIKLRIAPRKDVASAPAYIVPFTLRDAKRLRDWLNNYIKDREGILR